MSPLLVTTGAPAMSAQSCLAADHPLQIPIVVFDANETFLNFNVLVPVIIHAFDYPKMLREWFNQVDSEALTLAGQYVDSGG
jgi:hypothetical protein